MKKYEFPFSGSGGKGDSWEGIIDAELSEEDYARLRASALKGFYGMWEDEEIKDIYDLIYQKVIDETLLTERSSGMIEEHREDLGLDAATSDHEVIECYLDEQCCHIHYPYELS